MRARGLLRNAAVALGNWGAPEAVPALAVVLNREEPLVRGHAAWALGRIGTEAARQALRGREEVEEDAWVREEIGAALELTYEPAR
ncbi:MAG TPA: HEAT repeat domain-containing protein [Longimicrobium sp.]|nr:HEAT repeat domain-containing protein [Longimicrobium sp.]